MSCPHSPDRTAKSDTLAARREFLAHCGRFAVVTPPAIALLLSTSLHSSAIAFSSGRRSSDSTFDPKGRDDRQFVTTSHDNNSNSSGNSHSSDGGGDGDQGGSHGHGHMYSDAGSGGHGGHDNSGLGEDDEGKHHHDH